MSRLSLIPLLIGLCFSLQAADNALPNPGFESESDGWSVSGDARLQPEAAHSGARGLRVGAAEYSAEGSSVTSARLPVTPGQQVTLSFQVRSRAACSGAYLWLYNDAGKTVNAPKGCNTVCWVAETNDVWTARTLTVTIPAGIASVAVWIHSSPGVTGFADYDDLALSGIAPGAVAIPPPPSRPTKVRKPIDPATLPARPKPVMIVLKLDDLKQVHGRVHPTWKHLDEVLEARNIKAGYGVICDTLPEATPEYAAWIRARRDAGRVEFWFHGWCHSAHEANGTLHNEFAGWTREGFKAVIDRSQQAAQDKLGFAFAAFGPTGCGAPGPNLDEAALLALRDDPNIRVALYPTALDEMGQRAAADGTFTILDRVWDVNLEGLVGVPDSKRLIAGYAAHPERAYFVLQGHPAMWGPERFEEFVRILDFLQAQKAVFMTPSECAAALRAK